MVLNWEHGLFAAMSDKNVGPRGMIHLLHEREK